MLGLLVTVRAMRIAARRPPPHSRGAERFAP
jgi:hypothetical protein